MRNTVMATRCGMEDGRKASLTITVALQNVLAYRDLNMVSDQCGKQGAFQNCVLLGIGRKKY